MKSIRSKSERAGILSLFTSFVLLSQLSSVSAQGDYSCTSTADCPAWAQPNAAGGPYPVSSDMQCVADPLEPQFGYCGYAGAACKINEDCDYGKCTSGKCTGYLGQTCADNSDCMGYFMCGTDGMCGGASSNCTNGGQDCMSGKCIEDSSTSAYCSAPAARQASGQGCATDSNCATGLTCTNNICKASASASSSVPSSASSSSSSSSVGSSSGASSSVVSSSAASISVASSSAASSAASSSSVTSSSTPASSAASRSASGSAAGSASSSTRPSSSSSASSSSSGIGPSQAARRFKRHSPHERIARAVNDAFVRGKLLNRTCPFGYTACAHGLSSAASALGFECVNTANALESCGGCIGEGGVDCTMLPYVDDVRCEVGKCNVVSCIFGKTVSADGSACI